MSRRFMHRITIASLLFLSAVGLGVAYANAGAMVALTLDQLMPSSAAGLLGPISEEGRTGWACRPERAAAARSPKAAELPDTDTR